MASTVFLHVGAPLAPSTTLRDALARHRRRLARVGVLYPPAHLGFDGGHREAVLDALGLSAERAAPAGSWDRLAEGVRDWRRGTAVVSHELLADATPAQVDRIVSSLGSAEVHVVYVAQDLGRQLPRAWQEWVHQGGTAPFSAYAARVLRREPHRDARVFWRSHDLGEVLTRWQSRVPADRVHVVTSGGSTEQTWARLTRTLGIDAQRFRLGAEPVGRLDALAATEVLRLLNAAGPADGAPALDAPAPNSLDPNALARVHALARSVTGPVPRVPAELGEAVRAEADRMLATVDDRGWQLVGSADDLRVDADAFAQEPGEVAPAAEDVVSAQTLVLRGLCGRPPGRRGPAGVRRRALRVLRGRIRP